MSKERIDVYQEITDSIVASMEAGLAGKWSAPWHKLGGHPSRSVDGRAYSGLNSIMLKLFEAEKGYGVPCWGTYKAWTKNGAQVRKGEKATLAFFWNIYEKEEDGEVRKIFTAKAFHLFNVDQVDGYEGRDEWIRKYAQMEFEPNSIELIDRAETCLQAYTDSEGIKIFHGGNVASYDQSSDRIKMPMREQFKDSQSYYSTLAHESAHSTMTKDRCDRPQNEARFGSEAYAFEELVAELAAAFMLGSLGISTVPREDHVHYLSNWLRVLRKDKRAIFTAASLASKAADYMLKHDSKK